MIEILTAILVLITAYYAWQTRQSVKVMQSSNEANSRPVVSVSVVNDRPEGVSFIDFVIRNSGNGLARNIKFTIKGDVLEVENIGQRKSTLKDVAMISNGIKTMAPGETRRSWLLSAMGRTDELIEKKVVVAISYQSADLSKIYDDEFILDFASLTRIQLGHDPINHIDKELEKIRKILEKKK